MHSITQSFTHARTHSLLEPSRTPTTRENTLSLALKLSHSRLVGKYKRPSPAVALSLWFQQPSDYCIGKLLRATKEKKVRTRDYSLESKSKFNYVKINRLSILLLILINIINIILYIKQWHSIYFMVLRITQIDTQQSKDCDADCCLVRTVRVRQTKVLSNRPPM